MLKISKRIEIIKSLLDENTNQSLTYAALECRLTLEYICYERFKLSCSYLSEKDLNGWRPRDVVKQMSEEVDEDINKGFTISVCKHASGDKVPKTRTEYESLEYNYLGEQSALKLNRLHSLWQAISNVALHIPIPNIKSEELNIYGNNEQISKKVTDILKFLSTLNGNILMGGSRGETFNFECFFCETPIKKPFKYLASASIVNCINPNCGESYLIEPDSENEFEITRRVIKFPCHNCKLDLEIPSNTFNNLRFRQVLNATCGNCNASTDLIMSPMIKENIQ
ncbi:hypothetical protein ABFY09_08010 [Marinomonas sp. 5E14-1]|uniref:hypothetical protein n=1 Tax=Marinomonas sp. 5E14-1 TaxID=3153922 RepID=UPI0032669564